MSTVYLLPFFWGSVYSRHYYTKLVEQETAGAPLSGEDQDGRMVMATWIVTLVSPLGGYRKRRDNSPQSDEVPAWRVLDPKIVIVSEFW